VEAKPVHKDESEKRLPLTDSKWDFCLISEELGNLTMLVIYTYLGYQQTKVGHTASGFVQLLRIFLTSSAMLEGPGKLLPSKCSYTTLLDRDMVHSLISWRRCADALFFTFAAHHSL
jgi:hypothetical protein